MPKPSLQVIPWTLFVLLFARVYRQRTRNYNLNLIFHVQVGWRKAVVLQQRRLNVTGISARHPNSQDDMPFTFTIVSISEKSVDCPPTVPQYLCSTPFLPPTTTVLAPSSLAMVMLKREHELAHRPLLTIATFVPTNRGSSGGSMSKGWQPSLILGTFISIHKS